MKDDAVAEFVLGAPEFQNMLQYCAHDDADPKIVMWIAGLLRVVKGYRDLMVQEEHIMSLAIMELSRTHSSAFTNNANLKGALRKAREIRDAKEISKGFLKGKVPDVVRERPPEPLLDSAPFKEPADAS